MLLCVVAVAVAGWVGRRRRPLLPGEGCEIMLTGRYASDNWILAHLGPLAASKECSRLWMVSTNPVPEVPKVAAIYPPKWLTRLVGVTPARLLVFTWAALRKRPHVVGGFHIMPNGIVAVIVGRLVGARSWYFSVGGPTEVRDGGGHVESKGCFRKMETPDAVVERRLLKIVSKSQAIITMGSRAVDYFRDKGVDIHFHVMPGGMDCEKFHAADENPAMDVILVGRLDPIKRIDVLIRAVRHVADEFSSVRAVVVGDGELREELRGLAQDLGLDNNLSFAGHKENVENWLCKSRIFVLTSDSEGLSLSLMEAMMCGLPAVVSNVGDLADLVEDGVNGYLVPRRSPESFAARIIELLTDSKKLEAFSRAARRSAMRYETQATTRQWDHIISSYRSS